MLPTIATSASRKHPSLPTERGISPPRAPVGSNGCRDIPVALVRQQGFLSEMAGLQQLSHLRSTVSFAECRLAQLSLVFLVYWDLRPRTLHRSEGESRCKNGSCYCSCRFS